MEGREKNIAGVTQERRGAHGAFRAGDGRWEPQRSPQVLCLESSRLVSSRGTKKRVMNRFINRFGVLVGQARLA